MTLDNIAEDRKYTKQAGSVLSSTSIRSATSVASSAYSTASKVRKYLDDAVVIVQNINSQVYSLGDQFDVEELREQLKRACKASVHVSTRADEFSPETLQDFIRELNTLQECIKSLPESTTLQLEYDLSRIARIRDTLREVAEAKSKTVSVAGSHGTFAIQQHQAETQRRLSSLEDKLSGLISVIASQAGAEGGLAERATTDSALSLGGEGRLMRSGSVEDMDTAASKGGRRSAKDAERTELAPALHMQQIIPSYLGMNGQTVYALPHSTLMPWQQQQQAPHGAPMHPAHYGQPGGAVGGGVPNGCMPSNIVIHNNLASENAANAEARQHSSHVSSFLNSVRMKVRNAVGNPLVSALLGGAAMLLLHNHVPVLKHVAKGDLQSTSKQREEAARQRQQALLAKAALKRTLKASVEAVEDCHDAVRDWREHSRRLRSPFLQPPEPDASRCDVRRIKRSLQTVAAADVDATDHEDWRLD